MRFRKKTRRKMPSKRAESQQMAMLGQYLGDLRNELGMSLREAAGLAKISPAHLCKIEKGYVFKSIGVNVLIHLAYIYGIPLISILEEADLIQKNTGDLPDFPQYLRSKYSLSPQAIRDLEIAKEVIDKKYNHDKNQPILL